MNFFLLLQILFDGVFLFGILFLFHYFSFHAKKRSEEQELLKNLHVHEVKENLQELLETLRHLGKEVSDNIKAQVEEAEAKSVGLNELAEKIEKEIFKLKMLYEEIGQEKEHLEKKSNLIRIFKGEVKPGKGFDKKKEKETLDISDPGEAENKKDKIRNHPGYSSNLIKEVYRMADAEIGIPEIMQRTNLTKAEIQLILNLRGNKYTASN